MIYVWGPATPHQVAEVIGPVFYRAGVSYECVQTVPNNVGEGDVILGMGGKIADYMKASGLVPKSHSLKTLRGKRIEGNTGAAALLTYAPAALKKEPKLKIDLEWDAALAIRLHETGSMRPQLGKYGFVDNLDGIIARVEEKFEETGKRVAVAFDLETMGLWPYYKDKDIVTSQFTVDAGTASVIDHRDLWQPEHRGKIRYGMPPDLRAQFEWLLNSPKVKLWGANLKFDMQWIWQRWKIRCTNFSFDSLLVGSLLDENRSNSLTTHSRIYSLGLAGYDDDITKAEKAHMELIEKQRILEYGGGDTDACYQTCEQMGCELAADPALANFYVNLVHPAARAFEKIEMRGDLIDVGRYLELEKEVKTHLKKVTSEAWSLVPLAIRQKHIGKLKWTRDALKVEIIFGEHPGFGVKPNPDNMTEKTKLPSTAMDHLQQFRDHPKAGPLIEKIEEIGKAEKTLGTYVGTRGTLLKGGEPAPNGVFNGGFLSHLRPDSRFHPTYMLYAGSMFGGNDDDSGTNTGRLAAKNPARQTIPKHTIWAKPIRRCFIAPPGMLRFQIDFSQGELRVAACLADETNMLEAYRAGIDLHAKTAAEANGFELAEFMLFKNGTDAQKKVFKSLRQGGKAGNFGLLYRMKAPGFVDYAWKTYGVKMTLKEAEDFRNKFFASYPGLLTWHDRQIEHAQTHGFVRSPLGRVRHIPTIHSDYSQDRSKAERQSINSPVQATLSDLNLFGIVAVEKEFEGHEDEFAVIGATHDSTDGYVREDLWEQHLTTASQIMGNLPIRETFGWDHQIDFPVDVELGKSLGELEEISLAA